MMIHEITELAGADKNRMRIGRGPGSGKGKTAGRGTKGAGSRSGWSGSIHPQREGGQSPFWQRLPKRGFSNHAFRTSYVPVNLSELERMFENGAVITPEVMAKVGLIRNARTLVKILANGDITKSLKITASKFSKSAIEKIEKAGGTATQG